MKRPYLWHPAHGGAFPADELLGVDGFLTRHARRLAAGRSIGSGAVEGGIKQLVNLRMKRTGARWRVEHVGPLVELRAMSQTPAWQSLWVAA